MAVRVNNILGWDAGNFPRILRNKNDKASSAESAVRSSVDFSDSRVRDTAPTQDGTAGRMALPDDETSFPAIRRRIGRLDFRAAGSRCAFSSDPHLIFVRSRDASSARENRDASRTEAAVDESVRIH